MSDLAWPLPRARPEDYTLWFSFSVTYDFLATEDINRDKIQDVLFLYKNSNSSNNSNLSCADEGNCFYLKKEELAVGGGILPPLPPLRKTDGGVSVTRHVALPSRTRRRQGSSPGPSTLASVRLLTPWGQH